MEEKNVRKSMFTVKKILKVLSGICLIMVFCPAFMISCSGQKVNVSVMTAAGGATMYGERVDDPHPIMLLCLLIPIVMLALLFARKYADKKKAAVIAGCGITDLFIWLIFRSAVRRITDRMYWSFETTGWFVINIITLGLITLLTILVAVQKLQIDYDLINAFTGDETQLAGSAVLHREGKEIKKIYGIGVCAGCGNHISNGARFCMICGKPAVRSLPEKAFCQLCGSKLSPGALFCGSCGTSVETS